MGLLNRLKDNYNTLSIIGMAKNAGKTTALNYLIEQAMDDGICLGITSTGRDGETIDLVTCTEKPKIFLETGAIVTVPVKLYEQADAGLEILRMTEYGTPLGQILICRVAESGYVQIAGPLSVKDHKKLCAEMIAFGAEIVLIDGAIDRKSIAAPGISDGVIIATGAVISRSMKKVVEETLHLVNLYSLPALTDEPVRKRISENSAEEQIILFDKNKNARLLDLKTGLSAGRYLDEVIDEETAFIYIPGALTLSVVSDIHPAKFRHARIIVKDATKIFIESSPWQHLTKKGFRVEVLEPLKVAALTVNPYSPAGYSFDHEILLAEMRHAIPTIPIIDVKLGGDVDAAGQFKDEK
jgi:hypothetical protein